MTDAFRLPGPMVDARDWQYSGVCRNPDTELFSHPEGECGSTRRRRVANAKATYTNCPVIDQCCEYALAVQELYGIWSGMTGGERCEEIRPKTCRVSRVPNIDPDFGSAVKWRS